VTTDDDWGPEALKYSCPECFVSYDAWCIDETGEEVPWLHDARLELVNWRVH
jgi:hypothetical protein